MSPTTNTNANCGDADEVSCWICLDEGPDETGKPLVRDCSCRGSTGFAHLSCIVEYSQQKGRQHYSTVGRDGVENPWEVCPSCHQEYQNIVGVDLATEYISFVEMKNPQDEMGRLQAYLGKIVKFRSLLCTSNMDPNLKKEAKQLADKALSLVKKMNVDSNFMQSVEQDVYDFLGIVALNEGTKESAKVAMSYFEKCLDLRKALGSSSTPNAEAFANVGVSAAETTIAMARSLYEGQGGGNGPNQLPSAIGKLDEYQCVHGKNFREEDTPDAIQIGVTFAFSLKNNLRTIEAERLLSKLAATSLRVHGPMHTATQHASRILERSTVRYVSVKMQTEWIPYQILRYEDGGERCFVKGPVSDPNNFAESLQGNKFTVDRCNVHPYLGTPVVCCGLKKAGHLNGKVGDIRNANIYTGRFEVHFEDINLKPCMVRPDNLEILFELPAK